MNNVRREVDEERLRINKRARKTEKKVIKFDNLSFPTLITFHNHSVLCVLSDRMVPLGYFKMKAGYAYFEFIASIARLASTWSGAKSYRLY